MEYISNTMLKLIENDFGVYEGKKSKLYTIRDEETGFEVSVSDFGATLVRVKMPDKNGNISDINFGQDTAENFVARNAYLGAVVGRIANRIANGEFELNGNTFKLIKNLNNKHHLHGGTVGFNYKFWDLIEKFVEIDKVVLIFQYISNDGEEGYPGTLTTEVKYVITPMVLEWFFKARTDKTTIVNLTNHAYWNLEGLTELVDSSEMQLFADKWMPVDEDGLVTGEIKSMDEASVDLRNSLSFSEIFSKFGDVDNNFFVSGYKDDLNKQPTNEELNLAAILKSPNTGRIMEVYTTEPCIQVYTGNFMEGVKSFDIVCKKHSAVCFETQRVPNAINIPEFKNQVILNPEQEYYSHTKHVFKIEQ